MQVLKHSVQEAMFQQNPTEEFFFIKEYLKSYEIKKQFLLLNVRLCKKILLAFYYKLQFCFQGSSNQRGMAWCEPTRGHGGNYLGSNLAADRHGGSVQVRICPHYMLWYQCYMTNFCKLCNIIYDLTKILSRSGS